MPVLQSRENSHVKVPKASELVAQELRRRIIRGELQEGEVLPPEIILAREFGVSRPSIREAMRLVESEHLIEIRRGAKGGAVVRQPALEVASRYIGQVLQARGVTLADVYAARCAVEPAAARLAAAHVTNAGLRKLEQLVEREAAAQGDPQGISEASADFHQAVVDLSGNETLRVLMGTLHGVIVAHNADSIIKEANVGGRSVAKSGLKSHRRLIELLATGDGEEAESFWRLHLEKAGENMLRYSAKRELLDVMS